MTWNQFPEKWFFKWDLQKKSNGIRDIENNPDTFINKLHWNYLERGITLHENRLAMYMNKISPTAVLFKLNVLE